MESWSWNKMMKKYVKEIYCMKPKGRPIKDGVFCDNNKTLEIISDKEGFEDQPLKRL